MGIAASAASFSSRAFGKCSRRREEAENAVAFARKSASYSRNGNPPSWPSPLRRPSEGVRAEVRGRSAAYVDSRRRLLGEGTYGNKSETDNILFLPELCAAARFGLRQTSASVAEKLGRSPNACGEVAARFRLHGKE